MDAYRGNQRRNIESSGHLTAHTAAAAADVYSREHEHQGLKHQQRQHYSSHAADTEASQNCHVVPDLQYPTRIGSYFVPAAAAPFIPGRPVNDRLSPVQVSSVGGVLPVINAARETQPSLATSTVNMYSMLPDQLNVTPHTTVSIAPGTFFFILCIILPL